MKTKMTSAASASLPKSMTPKQLKVLVWVAQFTATHHYPPTLREIAVGLGLKSHTSTQQKIEKLVGLGLITKARGARSLTLTKQGAKIIKATHKENNGHDEKNSNTRSG
jgi:DNA-binding MarR family transcriptional regulator